MNIDFYKLLNDLLANQLVVYIIIGFIVFMKLSERHK
jgi:hypothetical protein